MGEGPVAPIEMRSAGEVQFFDSVEELGLAVKFFDEHQFDEFIEGESTVFVDAVGQRFRVLVISGVVVLCVPVPTDFDVVRLNMCEVEAGEQAFVCEVLDRVAHRGLEWSGSEPSRVLSVEELADFAGQVAAAERLDDWDSWPYFNETWLELADPTPRDPEPESKGGLREFLGALFGR